MVPDSPESALKSNPGQEVPRDPEQIDVIRQLLAKHKKDPYYLKRIMNDLKAMGIKPERAPEWTGANLRSYLTTNFPNEMAEIAKSKTKKEEVARRRKVEARKPDQMKKAREAAPKAAPKPSVRKEIIPLPSQEPPFREDLKNAKPASYRVPRELYDLVEDKIKRDKRRTGGSVASLVRILLWLYVGAPEEFLEPEYKPE